MGRLNSAASSVAVPLAISVTSQAASTVCELPSHLHPVAQPALQGGLLEWRRAAQGSRAARTRVWACRPVSAARLQQARARCTASPTARLPGRMRHDRVAVLQTQLPPRGARSGVHGNHAGKGMAHVRGGDAVTRQQLRLEREQAQHVVHAAADLLHPLGAPGPDRRADEVHGADALQHFRRASSPRLKSGASTPMNTSGPGPPAAASRNWSRMPTDLAVVAQHLDIAAHRQLLAAATRPRKPLRPCADRRCLPAAVGPALGAARSSNRRAGRRRLRRHQTSRVGTPLSPAWCRQRTMPRCGEVARKSSIERRHQAAASPRQICQQQAMRPWPVPASGRRGTAALCIWLDLRDALGAEKPRRRSPSTFTTAHGSGWPWHHHERRNWSCEQQ
jgi:hypothetical protein